MSLERRAWLVAAICGVAAAAGPQKRREGKDLVTLTGELEWMAIEGGFWTLKAQGKIYDLHAGREAMRGLRSGDKVQVRGRIQEGRPCFHMRGTVLEVESVRRV